MTILVNEEDLMDIIINAGEAKSCYFDAINSAVVGDVELVKTHMASGLKAYNAAHATQTKIIEMDAGQGKVKVTPVLAHAQDHIMTTMVFRDLANFICQQQIKINSLTLAVEKLSGEKL